MTAVDVSRAAPEAARVADVVAEVEAERARLSRMLHDGVAQSLLAARYTADLAGAPDVAAAVRAALREVSDAMWALRPRTSDGDLVRALDDLAARHRADGVVAVRADGVPPLRADVATVAYRAVQYAVAACSGRTVEVRAEVRSGTLTVHLSDDGPSYDDAVYEPGSELTRWLALVCSLGGAARVSASLTGGTTLFLEIPNALPEGAHVP